MGIEMPDINKIRKEIDEKNAEMEKKERERIKEEYEKLSEQEKPTEEKFEKKSEEKSEEKEDIKKIDERRRELDEEYERLTKKEFKTTEDIEKIAKIEKEHKEQSYQVKRIEKKYITDEKLLPQVETIAQTIKTKEKESSAAKAMEDKEEEPKKERKKLNPWESYKKHVETLSDDFWLGLDDIMNIFLGKDPEDLDYLKLHKSKLSRETPVWIEEETKEKQKEPKEENGGKEKVPPEEKIKEQLKEKDASSVIEKILQDPKVLSKIFHEAFEISEDADVQERWQELKTAISKVIEKKGGFEKEKEKIPDAVTKATEFINGEEKKDKKESPWGTVFGTIGWSILLFLVLFMLLELKGIDYLSGQTTGKKKEKK